MLAISSPSFLAAPRAGQLKMEDEPRQKHRPPRVDVERGPDRAFPYGLPSQAHAGLHRLARSELVLDISCRREQTWKSLVSSRLAPVSCPSFISQQQRGRPRIKTLKDQSSRSHDRPTDHLRRQVDWEVNPRLRPALQPEHYPGLPSTAPASSYAVLLRGISPPASALPLPLPSPSPPTKYLLSSAYLKQLIFTQTPGTTPSGPVVKLLAFGTTP